MSLLLLCSLLQAVSSDTLTLPNLPDPGRGQPIEPAGDRSPQIRLRTKQGTALVWLQRANDTIVVTAVIPDSTPYWGDDFVLSLDTGGDGAAAPQHDDFQFYFRRMLDSSVIFRGRNGHWEPPRGDPDWRLGTARDGGGWEVVSASEARGWRLRLRLDPAWLAGENGRLSRIALRIYDDAPAGWFSWPGVGPNLPATLVERAPSLWVPVR
jgi:hypothetical protein